LFGKGGDGDVEKWKGKGITAHQEGNFGLQGSSFESISLELHGFAGHENANRKRRRTTGSRSGNKKFLTRKKLAEIASKTRKGRGNVSIASLQANF
jgi:hypothetical protein